MSRSHQHQGGSRAGGEPEPSKEGALVRSAADGEGSRALSDVQGLAAALTLQTEILKRLHDQQAKMTETIQDTRRSEMMIQSTHALNESFSGMKRVQEKLLDRIDTAERPLGNVAPWLLTLGILGLVAAVFWGVQFLGDKVNETGAIVKSSNETLATASLDALSTRLNSLESRDTEFFKAELERLRALVGSMGQEKARLVEERDRAREDLGALRTSLAEAHAETQAQRARNDAAREDLTRLTERAMNDQRILQEMNKALETMRGAPPRVLGGDRLEVPVSSLPTSPSPAPVAAPSRSEVPVAAPGSEVGKPGPEEPARPDAATIGNAEAQAAPPVTVETLNRLLSKHRSSDVYSLTSVRVIDAQGPRGIVFEVRGADGTLSKSVTAERLDLTLTAKGAILEMTFDTGSVAFEQGGGRVIKSPFFNNRYQILAIGVDLAAWQEAALPFVVIK